jgi:hypothetical protein
MLPVQGPPTLGRPWLVAKLASSGPGHQLALTRTSAQNILLHRTAITSSAIVASALSIGMAVATRLRKPNPDIP